MKISEHDLFGDGVAYGAAFLVKAQVRLAVRPARLPVAQDIIDKSCAVVNARYASLNADLFEILKHADARKSLGLFVLDGGLNQNDLLMKADAKAQKNISKPGGAGSPPKRPAVNQSGQQRAPKGSGGQGNYQRKEMDTARAGSRGGKWYLNASGKVVYGTKPSGDSSRDLSPEEVQTHLKHYRPSPFMGLSSGDQMLINYLMDPKNQKLHGFTEEDVGFLEQWYGSKDNKTGQWTGGLLHEGFADAFGADLTGKDLSSMKFNQAELTGGQWVSFQEASYAYLKACFEENGHDFEDVQPHLDALFSRYENMKQNPKLQEALEQVGHEVERSQYEFFLKAADHEDDMKDFGNVVTAESSPDKQARTLGAALAALDLLFIPGKGDTNKRANLKGVVAPNAEYFKRDSPDARNALLVDPKRLAALPVSQLMAIAIGANMYACWDADQRKYNLTDVDKIGFDHNELGRAAFRRLSDKLKLNEATRGIIERQITNASVVLANKLNQANSGEDQVFKEFVRQGSDVLKDEETAEAIQKRHDQWLKVRDAALAAQKDDNFDIPDTMADGVLGGSLQKKPKAHQQVKDAEGNPTGEHFQLFQHQRQSINWMLAVKRGILALDAGMGKTPTVIAFMEHLKSKSPGQHKPAILFLPPSLMNQWPDEIASYAPHAKDKILNLSGLSLEARKVALQSPLAKKAEYILISTGTLNGGGKPEHGQTEQENDDTGGTDSELTAMLKSLDGALFIDEVHQGGFKTEGTVRNKIATDVIGDREHAFGMTATPMPNGPMDLFNLTNMFAPGSVGEKDEWEGSLHGTQYNSDTDQWEVTNPQALVELRTRTRPFVMHKLITDPDVQKDMKGSMQPLTSAPQSVHIDENHPMYKYVAPGGIIDNMVESRIQELEEARDEPYNSRTRQKLSNLLAVNFHRLCNISPEIIDPDYKGPSPKIDRVISDIIAHFKGGLGSEDKPLVLFSSFPQKAFPLLRKRLAAEGIDPSLVGEIHGGKSARERAFEQDMTNQGKRKILLVGTMSGGAGLNLQKKANKIMFLDEPWHPAAKRQAQGRVWRTGQKNPVQELNYRISLPQGVSWDEKVAEKLGGKQSMVTAMLSDVDISTFDFGQSADHAIDQLLGSSKDIKNISKRKKQKVNVDAVKLSQHLKDYYAEEFQDTNEDNDSDLPDVNVDFKSSSDEYTYHHDKDKQKKLGKEAKHISGAIDEDTEWKSWNQKFKQKNARQNYKVRSTMVEAYESGDNASPEKLKDAQKQVRTTVEQYRAWYLQAVEHAVVLAKNKDPEAKHAVVAAVQMQKDFPEAFEKQDWDPKSFKPDLSHEAGTKPPEKKAKDAPIELTKRKATTEPEKPVVKPQAKQESPDHIVSESNPFHANKDTVAHDAWKHLNKKKPKTKAEAITHLVPMLEKMGSDDPQKDAKALYAYMRKGKGLTSDSTDTAKSMRGVKEPGKRGGAWHRNEKGAVVYEKHGGASSHVVHSANPFHEHNDRIAHLAHKHLQQMKPKHEGDVIHHLEHFVRDHKSGDAELDKHRLHKYLKKHGSFKPDDVDDAKWEIKKRATERKVANDKKRANRKPTERKRAVVLQDTPEHHHAIGVHRIRESTKEDKSEDSDKRAPRKESTLEMLSRKRHEYYGQEQKHKAPEKKRTESEYDEEKRKARERQESAARMHARHASMSQSEKDRNVKKQKEVEANRKMRATAKELPDGEFDAAPPTKRGKLPEAKTKKHGFFSRLFGKKEK